MEEKNNTQIICYGSLKERWQEIEEGFDWQIIAKASNRLKHNRHNDWVFTTIDEIGNLGNIVLYSKYILIHGSGDATLPVIEAVLSEAVGSFYKCAASVHYGGTMPSKVMLFESESHLLRVQLSAGDLVEFGSFPQTAIGETQPLAWRVMEISADGLLLMSKKALMKSDYRNTEAGQVTHWHMIWENSMARMYCNGFFYNTAFTEEQKHAIMPQPVEEGCLDPRCTDAVFIPSESQLLRWLPEQKDRCASPTDYLDNPNRNVFVYNHSTAWWILPGEKDGQPECRWVTPKGEVQKPEEESLMVRGAIRPCIYLRLDQATLELLHRQDAVQMGKDSFYKPKDEVTELSEMLGARVGDVLYHQKPHVFLNLHDCEKLISKLTADYGFVISEKQIEEFFFRHGYLTRKPNHFGSDPAGTHLSGQGFFINTTGFGYPEGYPTLLPPHRKEMAAVLPELYRETLIKVDSEYREFLRIPLGLDDTMWLIRRRRWAGSIGPEFSLEIACMRNVPDGPDRDPSRERKLGTLYDQYSFSASDAVKLEDALRRTCGIDSGSMSVLITRYLDERRDRKNYISVDLDRLYKEEGIKPKQTRFWMDNETAEKRYIPMFQADDFL